MSIKHYIIGYYNTEAVTRLLNELLKRNEEHISIKISSNEQTYESLSISFEAHPKHSLTYLDLELCELIEV